MKVQFKRRHPNAILPTRGSAEAAGFDLYSVEAARMIPGSWLTVDTGWDISIQPGYEGQVRSRSGLARKHGISVVNAPGTIDSDYTGPLMVILSKLSPLPSHSTYQKLTEFYFVSHYDIKPGERIAQLVIAKVPEVELVEVDEFDRVTERGTKGFGSTGR